MIIIIEFKYSIGKKEFKVICDIDKIFQEFKNERENYEEEYYVGYYCIGHEDGYLTREEYNFNIDSIALKLSDYLKEEKMKEFIEIAQKKKNGTFYKNRIVTTERCGNCTYICEWHNTWIYNELRVKAISDTELEITYVSKTDTPA